MKHSTIALLCVVLFSSAVAIRAQVVPSAASNSFTLTAGALGSMYQPDYAGEGIAQISPDRLLGPGVYFDARLNRWVDIEGEGRWLHFNTYLGITENSYLIGPRVPIITFHRVTPYGKFLVGFGNGSFLTGSTFVLSYGGGVDYRLSKKFSLRAFDFEYQQWKVNPTISPYGGSVGIAYHIF